MFLKSFFSQLAILSFFGIATSQAFTLRVDFNDGGTTQSGWESIAATDTGLGDSWSKVFSGGVGLDVDAIGAVSLDDRDRGSGNGGGGEAAMWRDFLFANGSFSGNAGSGLSLVFTGLQPNTEYPVTIWAFDDSSNGGRAADWSGGSAAAQRLTFPDSPTPGTLNDYFVTLNVTTNGSGAVTINGVVSATNPSGSHNVFINGLEVGDPISSDGPTDLALSGMTIAKASSIGTKVGSFTTSDPTPADTFTYTFASGIGDTHNGQFIINGADLDTDRDLSGFAGGTILSVRIRTTDAMGAFYEEIFSIEVLNDSDMDDLDDDWELLYFANLGVAGGGDDNDFDSLTNLQEQASGTSPILFDTDNDNLSDGEEVNVLGTDPVSPDTDGDGLQDGVETNTGVFVSASDTGTNPLAADSDGDGFHDSLEISEGTDPNNAGDFPNTLIPLQLNEILTRNSTGISDGFGEREDWIEIFNPNTTVVNLDGYYLTDNSGDLTKWNFPAVTIPASGYLIVFASGKDVVDPGGAAHTNFSLSSGGEYLAIVRPDGSTMDDSFSPTYPEQFTNISYGPPAAGGSPVFFEVSTPGAVNNTSQYPGVVKDTNFSTDRGFYSATFPLAISSATPGATIRYTTDGSKPSTSHGTVYTGPIDITTTSTIRAIAYFSNWLSTNVDSHTYIFVDDVVQQATNPAGWPLDWTGGVPSDYEMDARVVNDTNGLGVHTVQEALLDIPTISLTMDLDDFVGSSNGIYSHPLSRWERECAVEYLHPDGTPGFQEDCKIEVHGNSSRNPNRMQKHSLRLTFSSSVGIPKLEHDLFPSSPVSTFNKLVLRACFTDSWALTSWSTGRYRPNDSQYFRDVWMKDSLGAMGQPTSYGNFVHVYVNGLYFGLHNMTERLEDDWYADHIGGKKEDWLINKDLSSPPARWNSMMSLANGSITDNAVYENVKNYIDVENYADYMLLHFYGDSEDWPHHNGYAAANVNSGDGKFRFFVWDQEIALDKFGWNRYSNSSGGGAPFQRLRLNDEFRILFADRVRKHLFNGGALSEPESIARYLGLAGKIDKAIVAESARWGDVQATTPYGSTAGSSNDVDADYYPPTINSPIYFTREQHWVVERDNVTGHYIPTLHDTSDSRSIIRELRSNNLYPSIDAPVFGQHGGVVANGFELPVTATTGAIYFTLDGSDPREVGGGVNPGAGMLAGGATVDTFIDLEDTGWKYLGNGVAQSDSDVVVGHGSYGVSDWKHPSFDDSAWGTGQAMLGYGTINGRTRRTTVGSASTNTLYFRKEFSVTGVGDYSELTFEIVRDDGAIVYLNGVEVDRSNLTGGNKTYADNAVASSSPEGELVMLNTLVLSPGDLVEGINVIAVELHQAPSSSSDLGMDLRVRGTKPNVGSNTVTMTQTGTLKARALNGGEWSALTEADFIVGTPAGGGNLVVSEIYYNPPGSDESTEWIELMNISAGTIDLTDVSMTGITYTFPAGWLLPAGGRIVVVKDQTAFAAAYNTAGIMIAPGVFTASLSNSGEELAIIDSTGSVDIRRFTYLDQAPWPTGPDGEGYSLVLVAPETSPDHGIAGNWRSSVAIGGSPGASDTVEFSGVPSDDLDSDGISALLEHAFGSINGDAGVSPESQIVIGTGLFESGTQEHLTITFRRNLAADDVILAAEISSDLVNWDPLGVEYVSSIPNGDGTETVTLRSKALFSSIDKEFVRIKVTQRP